MISAALSWWSDTSADRLSLFTPKVSTALLHRIVYSTLVVDNVFSDRESYLVLAELKVVMHSLIIYFWHLNIYSFFLRIMSEVGKAYILGLQKLPFSFWNMGKHFFHLNIIAGCSLFLEHSPPHTSLPNHSSGFKPQLKYVTFSEKPTLISLGKWSFSSNIFQLYWSQSI